MNEHRYLREFISDRFLSQIMAIGSHYRPLIAEASARGDDLEADFLQAKKQYLFHQAFLEKIRAEDVIHWLEIDNFLREGGKSYPDEYENCSTLKFPNQRTDIGRIG
jgi:hypothetical protein